MSDLEMFPSYDWLTGQWFALIWVNAEELCTSACNFHTCEGGPVST